MGGNEPFMGLQVWNLTCSVVLPKGTHMPTIEVEIKKKLKQPAGQSWKFSGSGQSFFLGPGRVGARRGVHPCHWVCTSVIPKELNRNMDIGLFFSVSLWWGSYFKAISSETECCSTVLAFSVSCVHRSVHLVSTLCVLNTLCALRKLWARNPLKIILFCSKFGRWWRIKCWPLKIASYRLLTHFLTFYLKCLLELSSALFTISSPSAV